MDKVYGNGLNWFGMSPHPTDRMFNGTDTPYFRVRANAKGIREDYDAIANAHPDLADALNRLIFKSAERGYNQGHDEGYREGHQDGDIFGGCDDE